MGGMCARKFFASWDEVVSNKFQHPYFNSMFHHLVNYLQVPPVYLAIWSLISKVTELTDQLMCMPLRCRPGLGSGCVMWSVAFIFSFWCACVCVQSSHTIRWQRCKKTWPASSSGFSTKTQTSTTTRGCMILWSPFFLKLEQERHMQWWLCWSTTISGIQGCHSAHLQQPSDQWLSVDLFKVSWLPISQIHA